MKHNKPRYFMGLPVHKFYLNSKASNSIMHTVELDQISCFSIDEYINGIVHNHMSFKNENLFQ